MSRLVNATLAMALLLSASVTAATGLSAAEDHGHDHAALIALGPVTLGTVSAKVAGEGAPVAGKEWHVSVELPAGTAAPKTIRVWVGIDTGRGSEKAKAEAEAGHPGEYEAHVNVPSPLPAGSQLWVSLEPTAGDTVKGSVALTAPAAPVPTATPAPAPKPAHVHAPGDGHNH